MTSVPLRFLFLALLIAFGPLQFNGFAVAAKCPGGTPMGSFRVVVESPEAQPALPLTQVNRIEPGQKLRYEPVRLAGFGAKAKVAVVLIGENQDGSTDLRVLNPKPALTPESWDVPVHSAVVGLAFGEHGLDVKKVKSLVSDNPQLVSQLADYADRSSKVEALVQTLANYEDSAPGSSNLQAMLKGFSSQYGVSLPRLDVGTPADQQANALLQALIPAFTPSGSGGTLNIAEHSTGLAASVASMFFGPQVGLAAGGAALLENLHSVVFPGTAFRPAFTQQLSGGEGLELCNGAQSAQKTRKNVAYLWVQRVSDATAPNIRVADGAHAALGWTSTINATTASVGQLKLVSRARDWKLIANGREIPVRVSVTPGESYDRLTLDLRNVRMSPGRYRLAAMWDWAPLTTTGTVEVDSLDDLASAKVSDRSADSLITGAGKVPLRVIGADFEFVKSVSLRPAGTAESKASEVPFELASANGNGGARDLDATIDTTSLPAGAYMFALKQVNGSTFDVPVTVHLPNPQLLDIPVPVNIGEKQQTVVLRGTGLDRITQIRSTGAEWNLSSVTTNGEREAVVTLAPAAQQGQTIAADLLVDGLHDPIRIPAALHVLGPRPRILAVTKSLAGDSTVEIRDGEIPAGVAASFAIHAENADMPATVELSCQEGKYTRHDLTLYPGEKQGSAELESAGQGVLFLSVDPGTVGSPACALQARMTTPNGASDPYMLGRIIRVPHIDQFTMTNEKIGKTLYAGTLTGENLEAIAKTGWSAESGENVLGIATPVPGSANQQTLKIAVPWPPPSPQAPLYIWLIGDTQGRLTHTKY